MSAKFSIMGRLTRRIKSNVNLDKNPQNSGYVRFTVSVWDYWNKKNDFFECVAFGVTASRVVRVHCHGRAVAVFGDMKKEVRKNGKVVYHNTDFIARDVYFPTDGPSVTPMDAIPREGSQVQDKRPVDDTPGEVPSDPDDLPF